MLWWVIYLTNRLHFPVCVCTVIDHRWRYSLERTKKYDTRQSRVAALLFITRCDVFSDLLQYTHMEKCNLFVLYNKNSNGLLKDFGGIGILGASWSFSKKCEYKCFTCLSSPFRITIYPLSLPLVELLIRQSLLRKVSFFSTKTSHLHHFLNSSRLLHAPCDLTFQSCHYRLINYSDI